MRLFYPSEVPIKGEFVPRPYQKPGPLKGHEIIPAIESAFIDEYMFPKKCPRVVFKPLWNTPYRDIRRYYTDEDVDKIIALDIRTPEEYFTCSMWLYEFDSDKFEPYDAENGYYYSKVPQKPINKIEVGRNRIWMILRNRTAIMRVPDIAAFYDEISVAGFTCRAMGVRRDMFKDA